MRLRSPQEPCLHWLFLPPAPFHGLSLTPWYLIHGVDKTKTSVKTLDLGNRTLVQAGGPWAPETSVPGTLALLTSAWPSCSETTQRIEGMQSVLHSFSSVPEPPRELHGGDMGGAKHTLPFSTKKRVHRPRSTTWKWRLRGSRPVALTFQNYSSAPGL